MVSVFFGKEDDQPEKVIMATKSAVDNGELYTCLPRDWLYTVRRKEARVYGMLWYQFFLERRTISLKK